MVNWKSLTPREVWDALRSPPKVAGPWEVGDGGEMDVRRAPDGSIVATTLWVVPKHPTASWRVPVATSNRAGADVILREHGWMLVDDEMPAEYEQWGVFIPAQWAKGIMGSCKAVAEDVASKMLRGPFDYEVRLRTEPGFRMCGEPHPVLGLGCMQKRGHTPVHEHSLDDGQKWSTEPDRCARGTLGCTSTHRFSDVCDP